MNLNGLNEKRNKINEHNENVKKKKQGERDRNWIRKWKISHSHTANLKTKLKPHVERQCKRKNKNKIEKANQK